MGGVDQRAVVLLDHLRGVPMIRASSNIVIPAASAFDANVDRRT